jgi:hypothetical protein
MTGLIKLAAAGFAASMAMGALSSGVLASQGGTNGQDSTASSATCQETGNQLVQNLTFTTSHGTFSSLSGHVASPDHVVAAFTVPANCTVEVSLVSYQAPGSAYDPNTASQQTVFDSKDVTFGAGNQSLSVDTPACFFQVDFVRGTVIQHLGPAGSTNFYGVQGRLIDAGNGGTTACSPTANGGSGGAGGTQGVTTTAPPSGVLGINTPGTGVDPAIGLAGIVVLLGLLLVGVAQVRRNRI